MSNPAEPTSYQQWKQRQSQLQPNTRHAADSKQAKPLPSVKQERTASLRQTDQSSGITASLQQISQMKKLKELRKKAKKKQLQAPISSDESGSDEVDSVTDSADTQSVEHADSNIPPTAPHSAAHDSDDAGSQIDEREVIDFTDADKVIEYRHKYGIHIDGSNDVDTDTLYYPVTQFDQLAALHGVDTNIVSAALSTFKQPSLIQQQCWPLLLNQCDVIGIAHTGSGKTLTFLLPIYHHILTARKQNSASQHVTSALILAPTRELVLQITSVAQHVQQQLDIVTHSIVGGPDIDNQATYIHNNTADILVCTLGRLVKLIQHDTVPLKLDTIRILVLDEADRILDLGFEADLLYIVSQLLQQRQTVLFSATFPPHIEATARKVFVHYDRVVHVTIGNVQQYNTKSAADLPQASTNVTQVVEVIDRKNGARERRLLSLLGEYVNDTPNFKCIIFTLYKRESTDLCDYLNRKGYSALAISGDKSQAQRVAVMQKFKSNECNILVATDVAARGIDILDITHVINFSVGLSIEHYIHRIGRCGRAGQHGTAYTFFVDYDLMLAPVLIDVLRATQQSVSAELLEMAQRAKAKAAKHSNEIQVYGDAAYRQYDSKDSEDVLGSESDDPDAKYLVQKPKKQHAIHSKGKRGRQHRGRPH